MNDGIPFEEGLKKLEDIVSEMEKNNIPLDRATKLFEEGIELIDHCNKILENTEKKISILVNKNGKMVKEKFIIE